MEIFRSIEGKAARIPDSVQKLRYLRRALRPKRFRWLSAGTTVLLLSTASVFALLTGTPSPSATISIPKIYDHPFAADRPLDKVWVVERHDAYTAYSNGLQIRTDYLTDAAPRRYRTYSRDTLTPSALKHSPAGIVYHTTESLLVPLEAANNLSLVSAREDLLTYIRNQKLYNLVIDRFGQVFRVVPEDQVAHHAGHSVWADGDSVYEGLNESFIGVSFEARTQAPFDPSPAQVRSGRLLTEILRSEYSIPESNCVTHAQVSVNPDNMHIGYHTDWGSRFPFEALGFGMGYSRPVAAVDVFGFEYDGTFIDAIGGTPWEGLATSETALSENARKRGLSVPAYRNSLQQRYHQIRKQA